MRPITLIIVHCSAVKPSQTSSAKQIDAWHKAQGWKCIGYHYVVRRDGTIEVGRPESQVGGHTSGYNTPSIGVCYEGGLDQNGNASDTRTPQQKTALITLLTELKTRYPSATIKGHNQFSNKACPCFNAEKEYKNIK